MAVKSGLLSEWVATILATWYRKILIEIYGSACERVIWRIRTKEEVNNWYKNINIITDLKRRRLEWVDYVIRMENNRISKILVDAQVDGKRKAERPKLRWLDVSRRASK